MRRRRPAEAIEPYRYRVHASAGNSLRDSLALWSGNLQDFGAHWPEMPNGITDRAADVWEPLIAIADAAGGEWPERSRVTAVTLVTLAMAGTPSLGVRLLSDLRTVFEDREAMATDHVIIALCKLDEAPWADLKGKSITPRVLANLLKRYEVKPKLIRIGVTVARGYTREDLHDPWLRYLGDPGRESVTSVTDVTGRAHARESVTSTTCATSSENQPGTSGNGSEADAAAEAERAAIQSEPPRDHDDVDYRKVSRGE